MDRWLAARLVRRAGFGASGPAVDAVAADGAAATVARWLAADPGRDPGVAATPVPTFSGSSADRKQDATALTAWWLRRMVAVHDPFGEKLTFVWHAHFATSVQKVRSGAEMAAQNERLRALGRGSFSRLAYAMLTDAAMLRWLDGEQNTAQAPNENLAREFLELFALGHGNGYTEQDVREGARALTGWRIAADGSTTLVPRRHDAGTKTVLGVTGTLDAAGFCEAVLAAPKSPGHLASRLWSSLVSGDPPDPASLSGLVAAYGPDRDLGRLLTAMLTGPWFAAARGTLVASPVEWLVGAVRSLRVPVDDAAATRLVAVLRALGQVPFAPPSVGGWPSGQAWLSTAAAAVRLSAAAELASRADLSTVTGSASDRLDAAAYLLGIPSWSDRTAAVLRPAAGNPATLVALALNAPENLAD